MDPFSFKLPVHPLPLGLGPFCGGGAMHTDPFSFGLDLARPPPPGFSPFYGGDAMRMEHNNPFSFGPDLAPPPVPTCGFGPADRAGFPSTPVYGNPFDADGAALCMEIPAPWDLYYDGHVQRAVEKPVSPRLIPAPVAPVFDGGDTIRNSTTTSPQLCAPYDDDIDITLWAQEKDAKAWPSPDYLETTHGGQMSPERRASLVRWMSGFTRRYDLAPGTLHRAVFYVDRFLSARPLGDISRHQLHLLGAAAVYVAAKYEDQVTTLKLDAKEISLYCGKSTTSQEVLDTERALLAALDYRLGAPTAYTFVEHFTRRYSQGEGVLDEARHKAHDLVDMSLPDYGCLKLKPSAVAAAAIFLAGLTLKPSDGQVKRWERELEELTGYRPMDLKDGVEAMRSLIPVDDRHTSGVQRGS